MKQNQELLFKDNSGNLHIGKIKRVRLEVEKEDGSTTLISPAAIIENE